jgi:hypothetical protein
MFGGMPYGGAAYGGGGGYPGGFNASKIAAIAASFGGGGGGSMGMGGGSTNPASGPGGAVTRCDARADGPLVPWEFQATSANKTPAVWLTFDPDTCRRLEACRTVGFEAAVVIDHVPFQGSVTLRTSNM